MSLHHEKELVKDNKGKESFLENYPYLKDYQDVFPKELPRLPPKKTIRFFYRLGAMSRANI